MKAFVSGLVLSGCFVGAAAAQDVQWRASRPDQTAPALGVTIGQPRPLADPPTSRVPWRGAGDDGLVRPALTSAVYRPDTAPPRVIRLTSETVEPLPPPPAVPAPPPDVWGTFASDRTPVPPSAGPGVPPDGLPGWHDPFAPDRPSLYVRAESLLWWFKGARTPPLVTTGPVEANGENGFLGRPGTVVLFGGNDVGGDLLHAGGRFTVGYWLDEACGIGVEASGFFLGQRAKTFTANSTMFPVLARPIFSLNSLSESAQETTVPGLSAGGVTVDNPSRLWGLGLDGRYNLCCGCWGRLDLLAGARYVELDENLQITEGIVALGGAGALAGSRILVNDRFGTRNQFFGTDVGLDYELSRGPWSLDLSAKVAAGNTHEVVNIGGNQLIVTPSGGAAAFTGGLLALPTNIGHYTRERFAVLPELGVKVGYQVTDWCRLSVGYDFLYWSSVVRPGDQVDRVVDVAQIPNFLPGTPYTGILRPAAPVRDTSFWAQGINIGVEFRY